MPLAAHAFAKAALMGTRSLLFPEAAQRSTQTAERIAPLYILMASNY